jgi:hypothetical protein
MKRAFQLLLSLAFLGFGAFLVLDGTVAVGVMCLVFGLACLAGLAVDRAGSRGAGQLRGPYLLLAAAIATAGVAIGLVLIFFAPTTRSQGSVRTATDARIFGAIVVVACLAGAFVFTRRWLAGRQGRQSPVVKP